jgi:2,3-dihydroxybenzoate-AMP ligase
MLEHCTPWPAELAARYRARHYWLGETFSAVLEERIVRYGERLAVIDDKQRWTYRELGAQVERLAAGLNALGIGPNDRVVVQLPNCAEFLAVIFALFRLGALPIFALPAHRQFEIGHFCQLAEAAAYIVVDRHGGYDYRTLARAVQACTPSLQHVLVLGEHGEYRTLDGPPVLQGVQKGKLPPPPKPGDVALFQLSGGSTGTPKLIPRTHDDYLYSVRASAQICRLDADSVYMSVIPAGHNFALSSPGSLGTLYAGGTVLMCAHPSPEVALAWIAKAHVTITALVPPLVPVWLDAVRSLKADLSSLKIMQVGGARFNAEIARRVTQEFDVVLQQVFGMAEGLVNYTRLDDPLEVLLHTQGRPISPDDEIRIVDDEERPVVNGEVGHLLTRGPYTIHGYYKAAEHNARAFTKDGFYRTGDMARQTAGGNLVVEGRAKDQINRGGEKISAEELEHQMLTHTGVADCAIVAMPDPCMGEKICAFVIRKDDALRGIDLIRFLRERGMATYKIPDRIEFVSQFTKTGVGKIDKNHLRRAIEERLAAPPLNSEP